MTLLTLSQFVTKHEGKPVDVDGYPQGQPYQCWDLWSIYAQECYGLPQGATRTDADHGDGFAGSVYQKRYDMIPELRQAFEKLGPDATAKPGDVVFWAYGSASHPSSHVAIVLKDNGTSLLVFSQNPGPPRKMTERKGDQLGYFRPRISPDHTGEETTTDDEEEDMHCIIQINDEKGLRYYDGVGIHNLTNPDQVTALQKVYHECHGKDMPVFKLGSSSAPWGTRFLQAIGA